MQSNRGKIIVTRDGHLVEEVPLDRQTLRIGRFPDRNELVLPDHLVSGEHAVIELSPEGPVLTDRLSSNGTFIAGQPDFLRRPIVLRDGMVVRIGPYELTFVANETVPATTSAEPEQPMWEEAPAPAVPLPAPAPPLSGLSRYLDDLPAIFQPGGDDLAETFLGRYLLIFESLWEPLEQRQDHLEHYFDPRTSPAELLPWLARWLDLAYDRRLPEGRVRALLSRAFDLHRRRGTARGLAELIELCVGLRPEIVEDARQPVFTVRLPPLSPAQRGLIVDLIREHKPAHAGYRLEERA